MSDDGFRPPRLARWSLRTFLPADTAEFLIGDLEEEAARVARLRGEHAARLLYWSQTWRSLASLTTRGARSRVASTPWPPTGVSRDLRIAVRALLKAPSFSIVVISTLALGIGATTAIYSVVDAVLVAPLPYVEPERIMQLWESIEDRGGQPVLASYVNFLDWRERASSMERLAAARTGALVLEGDEEATRLFVRYVTPDYLDIFDGRAAEGRLLEPDDNVVPGGHAVAVVSHRFWQRQLGGDPELVGRAIRLSGNPYVVVGILEASFHEPFGAGPGNDVDIFIPAMMAGSSHPRGDAILTDRRARTFSLFGRRAPGVSLEQAAGELDRIADALAEQYPGVNRGFGASVLPLSDAMTQGIRDPILFLWLGAGLLLAIACFNIAALMLVRGTAQTKDMAIRVAVGARRGALLRYAFIEALLLAAAGGSLGVVIAAWSLPAILSIHPTLALTLSDVRIQGPVLVAALAASIGAGILFGLLPAWRASRVDLKASVSLAERDARVGGGSTLRRGLVAFELASAMVLLSSSLLLVRGFTAIRERDSGFLSERLVALQVQIPETRYPDPEDVVRVTEALSASLAALPGVEWAESWGPGRPGNVNSIQSTVPLGRFVEKMTDAPLARRHAVGPGALRRMQIALLKGRDFEPSDLDDAPRVVILSASMAEELWPGEDPLGKQARRFMPPGADVSTEPTWTVVGVVADARHGGRVPVPGALSISGDIYFPTAQRPERAPSFLVRTAGEPDIESMRHAVRTVDPTIPTFNVSTMEDQFLTQEGTVRFAAFLMAIFGGAALFLSGLGVYGVVAFMVSQRTREIGLRAALGASRGATLGFVLRHAVALTFVGVAAGAGATLALARSVGSVVSGVPAMDSTSLVLAALALFGVAFLASAAPALRATRIAPTIALRD